MALICDVCQTTNRDRAMFCSGCARKLRTFLANGPSMLSKLDTPAWRHLTGRRPLPADRSPASVESLGRRTVCRSWLAGAMLLVTGLVAAMAWNGLSNASPDLPTAQPTGTLASDVAPSAVDEAFPARAVSTVPPPSVPSSATTPPPAGTATIPARQIRPSGARSRPASSVGPSPAPGGDTESPGTRWRDPRVGCEHLFFPLAARCAATHCLDASHAGHPHCDQVRAETRRYEARRDMTLN